MVQNGTEFAWTNQRIKAAQLVAEDELSDEDIAKDIGIGRQTLARWKKEPVFTSRVAEIVAETRAAVLRQGIASKVKRVRAYNDRWRRMQQVIAGRESEHGQVAGGESGLLVHTQKQIGGGDNAQVVDEYAVDTGLLREIRELEKQAAIETGEWSEKHEHSGRDGQPIGLAFYSIEEWKQLQQQRTEAANNRLAQFSEPTVPAS